MRLILALALLLLIPATASAQAPTVIYGVDHANPDLHVWAWSGTVVGWARCPAGGAPCEPLPVTRNDWNPDGFAGARPGETAPGTVFEATIDRGGEIITARTPAWEGTLEAAPPTLEGDPTVGATVRAVPGASQGGWATGRKVQTSIYACRDQGGGECQKLTRFTDGASEVVVDARYAGWYLSAAQWWGSGNNGVTFIPEAPDPGPFVPGEAIGARSAALGPVCCAAAPDVPVATLSPAPVVTAPRPPHAAIRARATRAHGRLIVGRVTCSCTVRVKVSGGGRRAITRTLVVRGAQSLAVPVRRGKFRVRVTVDGQLIVSASTRY